MSAPPSRSPAASADALRARVVRAREALARAEADALIVPASADFRWITGARARVTERLVAYVLPRSGAPFAIVPRLEADALAHESPGLELEIWEESEDPLDRLERRLDLEHHPNLLLGEGLRVAPLLRLTQRARCRPAAVALESLRAVKDPGELAAMRRAAANADAMVEATADFMRPGMTEREVAAHAIAAFEAAGDHDSWAIVASGPNGALPHHFPGDRRLAEGDVVILDVGAFTDGYGSDITRTYWLGEPPAEARTVYEVVNAARAAGIAAAFAGAACESVDRAAREKIERAGYGPQFVHRTGHGVGLEVHEPPYLVAGNHARLTEGMTHSIEPGVYLPGKFGVRLEDLVVVGAQVAERLNQAPFDPRPPRLRS